MKAKNKKVAIGIAALLSVTLGVTGAVLGAEHTPKQAAAEAVTMTVDTLGNLTWNEVSGAVGYNWSYSINGSETVVSGGYSKDNTADVGEALEAAAEGAKTASLSQASVSFSVTPVLNDGSDGAVQTWTKSFEEYIDYDYTTHDFSENAAYTGFAKDEPTAHINAGARRTVDNIFLKNDLLTFGLYAKVDDGYAQKYDIALGGNITTKGTFTAANTNYYIAWDASATGSLKIGMGNGTTTVTCDATTGLFGGLDVQTKYYNTVAVFDTYDLKGDVIGETVYFSTATEDGTLINQQSAFFSASDIATATSNSYFTAWDETELEDWDAATNGDWFCIKNSGAIGTYTENGTSTSLFAQQITYIFRGYRSAWAPTGLYYDNTNATLNWNAVSGANSYLCTVNDGAWVKTTKTSLDISDLLNQELESVSVTVRAYTSGATEYTLDLTNFYEKRSRLRDISELWSDASEEGWTITSSVGASSGTNTAPYKTLNNLTLNTHMSFSFSVDDDTLSDQFLKIGLFGESDYVNSANDAEHYPSEFSYGNRFFVVFHTNGNVYFADGPRVGHSSVTWSNYSTLDGGFEVGKTYYATYGIDEIYNGETKVADRLTVRIFDGNGEDKALLLEHTFDYTAFEIAYDSSFALAKKVGTTLGQWNYTPYAQEDVIIDVERYSGNLNMAPSINAYLESAAQLDGYATCDEQFRPANLIVRVDGDMRAVNASGADIGSWKSVYDKATASSILPVIYLDNDAEAQAFIAWSKGKDAWDMAVTSADATVLATVKASLSTVRAILDYSTKTIDSLRKVVDEAKLANAVVLSAEQATKSNVYYLQSLLKSVWVLDDDTTTSFELHSFVAAGVYGVVTVNEDLEPLYKCFDEYAENSRARSFYLVGHRGTNNSENTLKAYQQAYESGAAVLETDIQFTSDGYAVIMHDDTVDRTTDGEGTVTAMTLAEIKALTVDIGDFAGEKVPTFEEFLEAFADKDVLLFLDIKAYTYAEVQAIAALVEEYGVEDKIIAFSYAQQCVVSWLHELLPNVPTSTYRLSWYDAGSAELMFQEFARFTSTPDSGAKSDYAFYTRNFLSRGYLTGLSTGSVSDILTDESIFGATHITINDMYNAAEWQQSIQTRSGYAVLSESDLENAEFQANVIAMNGSVKETALGVFQYELTEGGAYVILESERNGYVLYSEPVFVSFEPVVKKAVSITLDGTIGANLYVAISDDIDLANAQMQITVNGNSTTVDIPAAETDGALAGLYKFTARVAAKEIDTVITAQLIVNGAASGAAMTYTVRDYINIVLADKSDTYTQKHKDLVAAVQDYCEAAAKYHGVENATIADSSRIDAVENTVFDSYAATVEGENAPKIAVSLLTESTTTIRLYIQATEAPTVTVNGSAWSVTAANGYYYADLTGVDGFSLASSQTFVVNGVTVTCSALSYGKYMDTTDGDLVNVMKALYLYAQAATAYKA